jgi:signal peptidase
MLVVFDATAEDALQDPWLDIPGGERDSTTLSVAAPPPGEERIVSVAERRYVVVLPPSLLVALHNVHPLLALWAINATLIFGVLTVVFGLLGVRKRRNRRTDRDVPLWVRLKRLW